MFSQAPVPLNHLHEPLRVPPKKWLVAQSLRPSLIRSAYRLGLPQTLKECLAQKLQHFRVVPLFRVELGSAFCSRSLGATPSEVHACQASSDEAHSLESSLAPQEDVPARVPKEPNPWCIDSQYQVYREAKVLNDKGVITRLLTVKQIILIGRLHTILDVQRFFTHHRLEWMARSLGSYSDEMG